MSEAKAAKRPAGLLACVLVRQLASASVPKPSSAGQLPRSVCPHLATVLLYLPTCTFIVYIYTYPFKVPTYPSVSTLKDM